MKKFSFENIYRLGAKIASKSHWYVGEENRMYVFDSPLAKEIADLKDPWDQAIMASLLLKGMHVSVNKTGTYFDLEWEVPLVEECKDVVRFAKRLYKNIRKGERSFTDILPLYEERYDPDDEWNRTGETCRFTFYLDPAMGEHDPYWTDYVKIEKLA